MTLPQEIRKTTIIRASTTVVWKALTDLSMMKQWMAEPEMELDVKTNWVVGGPIVITGFHHAKFVNNGAVLAFEPGLLLCYSHLSSLSRLPDKPSNHTRLEFRLRADGRQTELTLIITSFPTISILKHLDFYWTGTMNLFKSFAENIDDGSKD